MNPPMSSQTRRLPTTISKTKKVVYLGRPSTLLHLKMPCDSHLDHRHEVFLRYVSANARSTHCAEWSFYCSPERYNDRVAHWYVFDSVCRDRICDWKTAGCLVYWNDNILRIIQQKKQTFPQCSHEQLKSRPLPGAITAAKKAREIILEFGRGCGNNRVGFVNGWWSTRPEKRRRGKGNRKKKKKKKKRVLRFLRVITRWHPAVIHSYIPPRGVPNGYEGGEKKKKKQDKQKDGSKMVRRVAPWA